ncbi:MAG TPA: GMC family oxidoreductase [Bryobacteraceae bacterium]|nr:GMC family oxidoreductase [Bryobacteraceae bacterium]
MYTQSAPEVHDVIVIGSGAAGGMTAWNLAVNHGIKVLMLDAGTRFRREEFWTHVKPWQWRERIEKGLAPPRIQLDPKEQPYLSKEPNRFDLIRVWGRGGKTNIWGRVALRYSDLDFEGPARDGWEIPWPIRYKDIAPYYDKVEQEIGVCGGDDDTDSLPGSRYHQPPPGFRCGERFLKRSAEKLGIKIVNQRKAVNTQPKNGHNACHYCGACGRGCDVSAFFNSTDYLLDPAEKTGKLKIVDNAVVAHILLGDNGLAKGVRYFDRYTGAERIVYGKRIVLGASCVDSTRILLNSKIGNSSGVIGNYLCEQVRFHVTGFVPELMGTKAMNDDGVGGEHIYLPRYNARDGRKRDYLRGFGSQFWSTGSHASVGNWAKQLDGFGVDLKTQIKRRYPAFVAMHPYGEVLPYKHNRVSVTGTPKDRYGIPISRIEYSIGENERKMLNEMYDMAESIFKGMNAEIIPFERGAIDPFGSAIHEHGTCRMGDDPKRSALNKFNQMHDVRNVFVVDGSSFTTASEKNPTLTILALSWRASDYLAEQMRTGDL